LTSFVALLNEELSYLPLPLSMMDVGVVTAPSLSPGSVGAMASSAEFKNALVAVMSEGNMADKESHGGAGGISSQGTQGNMWPNPSMDDDSSAKAASMSTALLMMAVLLGFYMLHRGWTFLQKRKEQIREQKMTYGDIGTINEQTAAHEREMQRTGAALRSANMQQTLDAVSSVNLSSLDTSSQRKLVVPAIDDVDRVPSGYNFGGH